MRSLPWEEPVPTVTSVSVTEPVTTAPHERRQLPELLAPAGSWESFLAAIGAGADAIYIGGKKYGARQLAGNFDTTQLQEAIDFAHRRDVRVYVTVNTLIAEQEREDVCKFLLFLYEAGADAILIQDAGLALLARNIIPELALHASTQMTIHNREGAAWAAEQGFKRVVLSRELSLPDIREIGQYTSHYSIGLEVFIHGALCYGYSGQCLLSSSIGGRSGNRGWCAQPCRKPYQLVSYHPDVYDRPVSITSRQEERYCLSMHDLCTYSILDQIVNAPISALKIEGRMKSPEYVATVVRIYRDALNRIRDGSWEPRSSDIRDLFLAFNRGFTRGHIGGADRREVVGSDRQDHRGLPIGKVISYNAGSRELRILLSGNHLPAPGDGLHFFLSGTEGTDCGWEMTGSPVVKGGILILPCREPVPPGAQVFITRSIELEREVRRAMRVLTTAPSRQIPIDLEVEWEDGRPQFRGVIHKHNGETIPVSYDSPIIMESALKHPLTSQEIAAHFCRTGGTPFTIAQCHLNYPGGLFAVPGQMNQMRREFIATIESALASARLPSRIQCAAANQRFNEEFSSKRGHTKLHPPPSSTHFSLATLVSDLPGLKAAAEAGCSRVCIEADPESMGEILNGIDDLCLHRSIHLVWKWPRITGDATISDALKLLPQLTVHGINEIMVDNPGAARALRAHAPQFSCSGSSGLNVWNHHTVAAYAPLFSSLTLSPELSITQMHALISGSDIPHMVFEVITQGNLEVVVSENCFFTEGVRCGRSPCDTSPHDTRWGLVDPTNRFFPLEVDRTCRIHLFNAVETCTIDYIDKLKEIGIDRIAIDARFRSPRYIRDMVAMYLVAISRLSGRSATAVTGMIDLKEEIKKRARGGITHGPLLKGLREPGEGGIR